MSPAAEAGVLAGAKGALALAGRLGLVRLTLPWTLPRTGLDRLLAGLSPEPSARPLAVSPPVAGFTIRATEALLHRVPFLPRTCLYKALGRYAALRRCGLNARFVMGLRRERSDEAGHAWVELDGRPWGEAAAPDYLETFAWPPRTP